MTDKPCSDGVDEKRSSIVTDASTGHQNHGMARMQGSYSSPPCFMHELDPSYLGYLEVGEVLEFLNVLLEAERAGARGVTRMARETASPSLSIELTAIARDEAHFCGMLTKHIRRLGGEPSTDTGRFYEKLLAKNSVMERMALLERGQTWVARRLKETLPKISDEALHRELDVMLQVHERNIRHCADLDV